MEDSNPQETIADLHVGFLDRCATITPIFRIAGLSRLSFRQSTRNLHLSQVGTYGGSARTRTLDSPVMSRAFFHLNYRAVVSAKRREGGNEPPFS